MMWMREPLNVEVLPNACHLIQKSFYCKERPKLLVKNFLQHLKIKTFPIETAVFIAYLK